MDSWPDADQKGKFLLFFPLRRRSIPRRLSFLLSGAHPYPCPNARIYANTGGDSGNGDLYRGLRQQSIQPGATDRLGLCLLGGDTGGDCAFRYRIDFLKHRVVLATLEGEMDEIEKVRVLIPHWIEHNGEHAAEALEAANERLGAALEKLGGRLPTGKK